MSNDKFTTDPDSADRVSHDCGCSSSSRDDERKPGETKKDIIMRLLKRFCNYVLKQKWWVVIIIFLVLLLGTIVLFTALP